MTLCHWWWPANADTEICTDIPSTRPATNTLIKRRLEEVKLLLQPNFKGIVWHLSRASRLVCKYRFKPGQTAAFETIIQVLHDIIDLHTNEQEGWISPSQMPQPHDEHKPSMQADSAVLKSDSYFSLNLLILLSALLGLDGHLRWPTATCVYPQIVECFDMTAGRCAVCFSVCPCLYIRKSTFNLEIRHIFIKASYKIELN